MADEIRDCLPLQEQTFSVHCRVFVSITFVVVLVVVVVSFYSRIRVVCELIVNVFSFSVFSSNSLSGYLYLIPFLQWELYVMS